MQCFKRFYLEILSKFHKFIDDFLVISLKVFNFAKLLYNCSTDSKFKSISSSKVCQTSNYFKLSFKKQTSNF